MYQIVTCINFFHLNSFTLNIYIDFIYLICSFLRGPVVEEVNRGNYLFCWVILLRDLSLWNGQNHFSWPVYFRFVCTKKVLLNGRMRNEKEIFCDVGKKDVLRISLSIWSPNISTDQTEKFVRNIFSLPPRRFWQTYQQIAQSTWKTESIISNAKMRSMHIKWWQCFTFFYFNFWNFGKYFSLKNIYDNNSSNTSFFSFFTAPILVYFYSKPM